MATILDLLQALNRGDLPPLPPPAPSMPIPLTTAGQPATPQYQFNPIPEMAPQAPAPGLDMGLVNQYAGQAPTAPTLSEPTTIDKIAAVLGGIAYGPGYAQSLREERQRPQREYEAARERYQGRRAQGLELAERKRERQQELTQRRAEQQAEREFNTWVRKTGVTDEMALQQMRNAFDIQKIREQERINDERQAAKERAQQERDARLFTSKYRALGAKDNIAAELGAYDAKLTDTLSPAAAKWQSTDVSLKQAREERLARIAAGGNRQAPPMADIVDESGNVIGQLPYNKIRLDRNTQEPLGFPAGSSIRAQGQQQQPPRQAPQIPNPIAELGAQVMPVAQQAGPTFSKAEIRAYARRNKKKPEEVEAAIRAKGGTVQ